MITIKDALKKIASNSFKLEVSELKLSDSLGYSLAEDIHSAISMPPFSQSAMDGYAICGGSNLFKVVGEIKAGDTEHTKIKQGEAFRIFTGAMIPEGTTAIAKQEIVSKSGTIITLQEEVAAGTSIRKKGEEILANDLVLKKGAIITPAVIGLLSGLGFREINVIKKPKIAIVVTGNELTKPGEKLLPGRIYESNSYTLQAALKNLNLDASIESVEDDFDITKNKINELIETNDVVIITGGISVGDYDFVGESLKQLGVNQEFYKVKQKPGKPLYHGLKGNVKIFALPGNPAAALTCFYMYIVPALRRMMGNPNPNLEQRKVKLFSDFTKKGDRAHLLKASLKNGEVTIHERQSSAMLSSFVDANCLLFLSEEDQEIKKGQEVEVFMLP